MPVSDDGGSTSEIVKVVGGPGIGDIRSRLVRLAETKTPEAKAVYKLLSYRLPTGSPAADSGNCPAKIEWINILEGNHLLWQNISLPYRETIRSFLLQFHYKILKEIGGGGLIITSGGESNRSFDFRGGSLGNFFLTGCRLFFNSLEASIFQFARVTRCPSATNVVPVIATNHNPVSIGCTLRNGGVIFGQCEISHPGTVTNPPPKPKSLHRQLFERRSRSPSHMRPASTTAAPTSRSMNPNASTENLTAFGQNPLSKSLDLTTLHNNPAITSATSSNNLFFSKNMHETPSLPSPIRRVFYINGERAETFPRINALVPEHLETKKTIIYSMGSLYTSLLPCLVVAGVGSLISQDYVEARIKAREDVDRAVKRVKNIYGGEEDNVVEPILRRSSVGLRTFLTSKAMSMPTHVSTSSNTNNNNNHTFVFPQHQKVSAATETSPSISDYPISLSPTKEPTLETHTKSSKQSSTSSLSSGTQKQRRSNSTPFSTHVDTYTLTKSKILLLNGTHDRETETYTALDFILAITDTLNYSVIAEHGGGEMVRKVMNHRDACTDMEGSESIWRLWNFRRTSFGSFGEGGERVEEDEWEEEDEEMLAEMESIPKRGYLVKPYPPRAYITHLLYAEDSMVTVEVERIEGLGIKCVKVPKAGSIAGCERPSTTERGGGVNVETFTQGHFGVEELRMALEPLLL
ncbi:UNVERIFIED_CONTAM: hypothetical protein HDU68_003782 [Siphonaria sp. JEL0065]|nr:hypothetical protein HDU68_003782 [Siphonaria sp. JEL0065]